MSLALTFLHNVVTEGLQNAKEPVKTEAKHCVYDFSWDKLGSQVSNLLIASSSSFAGGSDFMEQKHTLTCAASQGVPRLRY